MGFFCSALCDVRDTLDLVLLVPHLDGSVHTL